MLAGHKLLWNDLRTVRDIRFDRFEPVAYPVMCDGLWGGSQPSSLV